MLPTSAETTHTAPQPGRNQSEQLRRKYSYFIYHIQQTKRDDLNDEIAALESGIEDVISEN